MTLNINVVFYQPKYGNAKRIQSKVIFINIMKSFHPSLLHPLSLRVTRNPRINNIINPLNLLPKLSRKRIPIFILVQTTQRMIHITVLRLIRTHIQQKRPHGLFPLWHLPVLDSHGRSLEIPPKREVSVIKILYGLGVCNHGFFFKVPDEAMADAWGEEVGEEECAEEDALGSEDHCPHLPAWVGEFEEGEEVHAFIVCFFEEGFDPARELISFMHWLEKRQ